MGSRLHDVVVEIERHAAQAGWDQPPRLYALVETADLARREPQLAARLGLGGGGVDVPGLTPVEQEELPEYASLEELLAGIAWPGEVVGAGLVVERLLLPSEAEAGMPAGESEALEWLAGHPQRQDVRIAAGVLRDGSRECVLRLRTRPDDVLAGSDLVPGLSAALAATLAD